MTTNRVLTNLTISHVEPMLYACSPPIPISPTLPDCDRHAMSGLVHYVIVRADLPTGMKVAQTIHAAGESTDHQLPDGTIAVALHAHDEAHLRGIAAQLAATGIEHKLIVECDGEAMAIGCRPTMDRAKIRKVLSGLPLVK